MRSLARILPRLAGAVALGVMFVTPAAADTLIPFTAVLNGPQEFPVHIQTQSQGVAFLTLDKETSKVCYAISYSTLQGTELLAHFHGPAAPGQTAPVIVNISPSPSPLVSPKNGCVTFTKDQIKSLSKGLIYINVHSTFAPTGEIRGQVMPVKGVKYPKVPPIASPSGAFLDAAALR